MTIHDHFDGSNHCVECSGPCHLTGDDRAVTALIRAFLESRAFSGRRGLSLIETDALREMGLDPDALMRRAAEAVKTGD